MDGFIKSAENNRVNPFPLISVIVPIYNSEEYLTECLDSIVKQTYQNLEIILVDDGSDDGSCSICDEYSLRDSRIRVIHQNNMGVSAARNHGIDAAKGDYIAIIDSDDYIDQRMVEKLYLLLMKYQTDMSICDVIRIDEKTNKYARVNIIPDEIIDSGTALTRLFEPDNWCYVVAWNKLYKRSLWKTIRYPIGMIREDEAVIHRLFGNCKKIALMSESLYFYRKTPGSIMNSAYSIQQCDKYFAFADRALYLKNIYRTDLLWIAVSRYWDNFINDYLIFINDKDKKRLSMMRHTLKKMYPLLVKTNHFASWKDNLSTVIFMCSPRLYQKLFKQ